MRRLALCFVLVAACTDTIAAGGSDTDAGPDDDPLVFDEDSPEAASLARIHRTIIRPSCAGQPGLCHAGQFEPPMATPASFYAALVNRPGLEHPDQLRVAPGAPGASLLVDKLRNRNVGTQMPLGAEPLTEAQIAEIEAWIEGGALRAPGAPADEALNELPAEPEIAVFTAAGERIDGPVAATVHVGDTLTLRQSVEDFETDDAAMPLVVFVIATGDGQAVVVNPSASDPQIAAASFDAAAPEGVGDLLDWRFVWKVPAEADLRHDDTGVITPDVALAGKTLSLIALYVDDLGPDGMSNLSFAVNALVVQP